MIIKLKELLLEKTLYHGTTIDAVKSIEKIGLMPDVGEFVKHAYDEYPEEDLQALIFATDKEQLDKAVTAITSQIAYKLNKDFHSVTEDEFIKYGAIIKIYDGDSIFDQRPKDDENGNGEHPYTVEPGDYYTSRYIHNYDDILTGHRMIRLLKRYGVWPRLYMFSKDEKSLRSELMRLCVKYHKDIPKDRILKSVMSFPVNNLIDKIKAYKKAVGEEKEI